MVGILVGGVFVQCHGTILIKSCPGYISETVMCRKLIHLGTLIIGW